MIRTIVNRIVCRLYGHLRGKLVSQDQTHKRFGCPRCGRITTYHVKAKP